MNPMLFSTKSVASALGFNYLKVLNRAEILALRPVKQNTTFFWNQEQIEKIKVFSSRKQRKDAVSHFRPENIKIIELFLSQKNNSVPEIQKTVPMTLSYINRIINLYLETKCVVVESKMNTIEK